MEKQQIDWLVMHQANMRIMSAAADRLGVPPGEPRPALGDCAHCSGRLCSGRLCSGRLCPSPFASIACVLATLRVTMWSVRRMGMSVGCLLLAGHVAASGWTPGPSRPCRARGQQPEPVWQHLGSLHPHCLGRGGAAGGHQVRRSAGHGRLRCRPVLGLGDRALGLRVRARQPPLAARSLQPPAVRREAEAALCCALCCRAVRATRPKPLSPATWSVCAPVMPPVFPRVRRLSLGLSPCAPAPSCPLLHCLTQLHCTAPILLPALCTGALLFNWRVQLESPVSADNKGLGNELWVQAGSTAMPRQGMATADSFLARMRCMWQ